MYYARKEGIDINNTLEDEQPDDEENEVEGKRRKINEEPRTSTEEEPTTNQRKKLSTHQALTTCKEEEVEDLPAEQEQEVVEQANKNAGAASPTLDQFSRETTETEGESGEENPPFNKTKTVPTKT